jgi:hypothetical protein
MSERQSSVRNQASGYVDGPLIQAHTIHSVQLGGDADARSEQAHAAKVRAARDLRLSRRLRLLGLLALLVDGVLFYMIWATRERALLFFGAGPLTAVGFLLAAQGARLHIRSGRSPWRPW